MKAFYLPLILFFLLVAEGVALEILPAGIVLNESYLIPHWVFICLVYTALFYDRKNTYYAVLYALIFGFLIDVVYTGILGVYMFSYAVVIYMIHGMSKFLHPSIYMTILLGFAGLVSVEFMINLIFFVIGILDMDWYEYMIYRLLPTVLANIIFLLIVYPFLHKWFPKWAKGSWDDDVR